MNENDLINLFFDRDESAITITQKKYGKLFRQIIGNICSSDEDVEECENDTYLQLWNSIPPTRPDSLKAFACKLARNIGLKKIEREQAAKRKAEISDCFEEIKDLVAGNAGIPEENLEAKELSSLISAFLRKLSTEKRVMFVKRYWMYESVEQISEEMNISYNKVSTTLFRVRKELQKEIKKQGY